MILATTEKGIYGLNIGNWHFDVPEYYRVEQGGNGFYIPKCWVSTIFTEKGHPVAIGINEKYKRWLHKSLILDSYDNIFPLDEAVFK